MILKKKYYSFNKVISISIRKLLDYLIRKKNIDQNKRFEIFFSTKFKYNKCFSFASGRMALYAALKACKLKSSDEVLVTGFTCSVVANAVLKTGAKIIYCDIDRNNFGT